MGERNVIQFYSVGGEFGCLSNFAAFPIRLGGKTWPTSEHYFQAQKFEDERHREAIRKAKSPMIAARMGRDRKKKLRRDCESVKVSVMTNAVRVKCTQHENLRDFLLGTGDAKLVEHTENDAYWGDGGDGSGRNMLGQVLISDAAKSQVRFVILLEKCRRELPGFGGAVNSARIQGYERLHVILALAGRQPWLGYPYSDS